MLFQYQFLSENKYKYYVSFAQDTLIRNFPFTKARKNDLVSTYPVDCRTAEGSLATRNENEFYIPPGTFDYIGRIANRSPKCPNGGYPILHRPRTNESEPFVQHVAKNWKKLWKKKNALGDLPRRENSWGSKCAPGLATGCENLRLVLSRPVST